MDISEAMNSWNDIYQAEAKALSAAAKTLIDADITNRSITFYSDSQPVLKSLHKKSINNIFILECLVNLNTLGINNKIHVNWVSGHTGYDGNEWADSLAKRGKFRLKTELKYKYPISNLRLKIKRFLENKLIQKYRVLSEESHTITD